MVPRYPLRKTQIVVVWLISIVDTPMSVNISQEGEGLVYTCRASPWWERSGAPSHTVVCVSKALPTREAGIRLVSVHPNA